MQFKPLARAEELVFQNSGNELLIYDLKTNKATYLNETASLVWRYCDGEHSVADINGELSNQLKTRIGEDLVWLALDRFNRAELLKDGTAVVDHLSRVSRRELIRKVGFATMIAFPVVSSIIAPKAIAAQSTCVPGCTPGCVKAGDDLCGGCVQNQIQFREWSSTDGSCSGTSPGTFITGGCASGGPRIAGNDRQVLVCY